MKMLVANPRELRKEERDLYVRFQLLTQYHVKKRLHTLVVGLRLIIEFRILELVVVSCKRHILKRIQR